MHDRKRRSLHTRILVTAALTALVFAAACSAGDTETPSGSSSTAESTSTTATSATASSSASGTGGASATSSTQASTGAAGGSAQGGGGAGGGSATGAGGSEVDAGTNDGCVPITNDASKIGATCVDTSNCPAGYTCYGMSGIVFQQLCEILCDLDCECPSGYLCKQFSDKGSTWTQCAP